MFVCCAPSQTNHGGGAGFWGRINGLARPSTRLRQTHFKFLKEENLDTALQTHVGQVSIGEMTRVSQFSWAIMVHGNATCRGDRG